jgi:hypothetical protein
MELRLMKRFRSSNHIAQLSRGQKARLCVVVHLEKPKSNISALVA